jgi:heme iron utilization protein
MSKCSRLRLQADGDGDPLGASRMTLIGSVRPVEQSEAAAVRKLYLASYPNRRYWVDYEDFSFHRMEVVDVYYVGGFGVMGWVTSRVNSSLGMERAMPT